MSDQKINVDGVADHLQQDPDITAMISQAQRTYEQNKCPRCGWVHQNLLQVLLCKLRKKKT